MSDAPRNLRPVRPGRPAARGPFERAAAPSGEREIHVLDRLAVVYRYRRIALAVFVLTSAALLIRGHSGIRTYKAQARILIEDERSTATPGLNATADYWADPVPYMNTQYRILRGRDLARRASQKLDLKNVPEFNGTAEPPSSPATMVTDAVQRVIALVRPAEAPPEPPAAPDSGDADDSGIVGGFLSRVTVTPVPDSKLVDVYFESTDPKLAAAAANTLADEYVTQNLEAKLQGTQDMLDWLAQEVASQQEKVQESERALAEYRERENAMSLDDKNNIVLSRLNALNDAVLRARSARIEKESLYKQVQDLGSASPDSLPVVSQNPQIQSLKTQLVGLQQKKTQLAERYGDRHPQVIEVNAQIADSERQLSLETNKAIQSITNEYQRARLEEQTFSANLEQAKADVQNLSKASVSYNVLEREARSYRSVYEALLQREKELRVSANSKANNVRVVERAEVPKAPVSAAGRRTWLMSFAVGLVAAIAVAYGLDYMNDTIKTPEDVTKHLKATFLGLVPSVPGNKHPILAAANVPHDFGEAFRSLRTSIISRYPSEGAKTMVVTSAQPLEGKTTTACNIAMVLAYGGARVLLIDADMRRPGMHRSLRLTNERGLSQVLTGQARVRDVIQRTVDPNLLAITAGKAPPNPSELLASERMKTLLSNLGHGPFDWIVIDTPPVLAVTDAVILAPAVHGVSFVIGAEMTRRRLAERAIETVMSSHPKMLGVVLNKVDFARNRYYYSRYHGHQYKNYYAEAV